MTSNISRASSSTSSWPSIGPFSIRSFSEEPSMNSWMMKTAVESALGIQRTLDQLNAARERARGLATRDQLTGLANRLCFQDRIAQAVAGARRSQHGVAVMFLDLTMAGLVHGFMQRELNDWMDIIDASVPFWWVRTFSGGMLIAGLLCMLYNMWMTAKRGGEYIEEDHLVPVQAD